MGAALAAAMALTLTYPGSEPLDVFILVLGVGFALLAGSANLMQLPFLTRTGGLLTYSKFASGLKMKGMIPSRVGMMMLYAPAMCLAIYCWTWPVYNWTCWEFLSSLSARKPAEARREGLQSASGGDVRVCRYTALSL